MKKIYLAIAILILSSNTVQAKEIDTPFKDLGSNRYKEEIEFSNRIGAVSGYNDGTFKPDKEITKAEFIKIMLDTLGYKQEDPIKGHWAINYIKTGEEIGFIEKGEYKSKDLDKPVTKEEVKRITQTALKYKGEEITEEEKSICSSYYNVNTDKELEEMFLLPYIKGILNDIVFQSDSEGTLTREQASVISTRIFNEDFRIKLDPIKESIEDMIEEGDEIDNEENNYYKEK